MSAALVIVASAWFAGAGAAGAEVPVRPTSVEVSAPAGMIVAQQAPPASDASPLAAIATVGGVICFVIGLGVVAGNVARPERIHYRTSRQGLSSIPTYDAFSASPSLRWWNAKGSSCGARGRARDERRAERVPRGAPRLPDIKANV